MAINTTAPIRAVNFKGIDIPIVREPAQYGEFTVKVVDYNGDVLAEEHLNTGDIFTLPTAPTHNKLVFQEWACALPITNNQITITNTDVVVGAIYNTASGQTEADIEVLVAGTEITLNMSGTKDWGDGTTDTATTHTYTNAGKYTISCDGEFSASLLFQQFAGFKVNELRIADNITAIPSSFIGYIALDYLSLPNTIASIGAGAFARTGTPSNITSPKAIIIPQGCTSIGATAFSNCINTKYIVLPPATLSFNAADFNACYSLEQLTMPTGFTYMNRNVASRAFRYCYALKKIITPNNIKISLGDEAFQNCYTLEEVPEIDGDLGYGAFQNCYNLKSVVVSAGVLDEYAFMGCLNLQSVVIKSCNQILAQCFQNCSNTLVVDMSAFDTPPTLADTNAFGGMIYLKILVKDATALSAFQSATNWATYASNMYIKE